MDNRQIEVGGIKCHTFDEIISLENLFCAWDEFKRGKIKKIDVLDFNLFLENNIFCLHKELKLKTYRHSDYTSFYIKDPKLRHIHKACVKDRVLHHAVFKILYPIFDNSFIFDSYSSRINKGTHRAVVRLNRFAKKASKNNARNCYFLKCDILKFFDSIDHKILISLIKKKIKDKDAVWLIEGIIKSYSTSLLKGIPLGNITSQLFANIYLNELDRFIKDNLRIRYYVRYCDDFLIVSNNFRYLTGIIPKIKTFLKGNLKLSLHPGKIVIKRYHQGVDFLGYVSFPHHIILRTKTKKRMLKRIEKRIKDLKNNKISKQSFGQTIQSYFGILKHCKSYKLKKEIIEEYGSISI
ncbi:MAG: reverse transcriptase/maturase family protein [Candidatus Pacebacteria bacterium]|nr:reverse transcriptase/maturase family protein [Candidatus Paceibacterota bacterium]